MAAGQDIETRLNEINTRFLEYLRWHFKYPGSVSLSKEATLASYQNAGISDPDDIAALLDNGIWPSVQGGSRSQGQTAARSNFYLEGYLDCKITNPDMMIALRKAGITPLMAYFILKQNPDVKIVQDFIYERDAHGMNPVNEQGPECWMPDSLEGELSFKGSISTWLNQK